MKSTSLFPRRPGFRCFVLALLIPLAFAALLTPFRMAQADSGAPADASSSTEGLAPDAARRVFLPTVRGGGATGQSSSSAHAYFGVAIQGVPWDMSLLTAWENKVGKKAGIVHFWQFWNQDGKAVRFQPNLMNAIRSHGSIPMISWPPEKMGAGTNQADFQLSDIINGAYDSYIRQYATDAKAWGKPFFLRVAHEMNGYWFPWSETANGNSRGQFVQAWRHIHDIFTSVGATNATWVWCPNVEFAGSPYPTFASLYPGDKYVDWTCLDGYNWGSNFPEKSGWISFKDLYSYAYNTLGQVAPNKPVMIGEFASSEVGGSKASWISDALSTQITKTFPRIKAHLWFNTNCDGVDWRVESSGAATSAFKTGIASSYHLGAQYGSLSTSPVPAP